MNDLITWLRAQLDDDERVARTAADDSDGQWRLARYTDRTATVWDGEVQVSASLVPVEAEHIARWDPARVLAEVDAKREIIGWCEAAIATAAQFPTDPYYLIPTDPYYLGQAELAENVVKRYAVLYADREGFRDEWRPR